MNSEQDVTQSLWLETDQRTVTIIDQTLLPFEVQCVALSSLQDAARAITTMQVRGAPLVGITAAYGVALAMRADASDAALSAALATLAATRPTAVNLLWALARMSDILGSAQPSQREQRAYAEAAAIGDEEIANCIRIGEHGLPLIRDIFLAKNRPVQILTHCNAGWLATLQWGTALAPIYKAHTEGIPLHIWVDETRPRNQGSLLTAWELARAGVPHTIIADNVGGHLMQHGLVDMCIVGSDRTTRSCDVCNKIGTYLKALSAHDNNVPFYAALPSSTIDWALDDGVRDIPIEQRSADEVHMVRSTVGDVRVTPPGATAVNYAFDVTPARLMTGLITERGVCAATMDDLHRLFPEHRHVR